jgi:hypothetical protein
LKDRILKEGYVNFRIKEAKKLFWAYLTLVFCVDSVIGEFDVKTDN